MYLKLSCCPQRRERAQKGSRERQAEVDLYGELEKEYTVLKASVTASNAQSKVLETDLTQTKEQLKSTHTSAGEPEGYSAGPHHQRGR